MVAIEDWLNELAIEAFVGIVILDDDISPASKKVIWPSFNHAHTMRQSR